MFNRVREYIKDDEFRLTVFTDRVHIINYDKVISLETEYLSIKNKNQLILIKGQNLVLNKLLDQELLVIGTVKSIEVLYDK